MSPRVLFEQDLETLKNKVSEMGEHAEISYDHMLYGIRENKEDILTRKKGKVLRIIGELEQATLN